MPAKTLVPSTARPAYHAHLAADGSWQLRVFDLPPTGHPGAAALLASPLGDTVTFHQGVDGKHSVIRVRGSVAEELTALIELLAKHGLPRAKTPVSSGT